MNARDIERILVEQRLSGAPDGEGDLTSLRWAILIEDAFDVTLTDDEMAGLTDEASARALLLGWSTRA